MNKFFPVLIGAALVAVPASALAQRHGGFHDGGGRQGGWSESGSASDTTGAGRSWSGGGAQASTPVDRQAGAAGPRGYPGYRGRGGGYPRDYGYGFGYPAFFGLGIGYGFGLSAGDLWLSGGPYYGYYDPYWSAPYAYAPAGSGEAAPPLPGSPQASGLPQADGQSPQVSPPAACGSWSWDQSAQTYHWVPCASPAPS